MARTLFLADGSVRLVFNEEEQPTILAGLIREYLGEDCEALFCGLLEEKADQHVATASSSDDYELRAYPKIKASEV